jgi:hypothetical protein
MFGTTYTCESPYSTIKFIRCKYRSFLPDEHLTELVRTVLRIFCASRTSDVLESHVAREPRCGYPCYIASNEMMAGE